MSPERPREMRHGKWQRVSGHRGGVKDLTAASNTWHEMIKLGWAAMRPSLPDDDRPTRRVIGGGNLSGTGFYQAAV